jgi:hypothetical protein
MIASGSTAVAGPVFNTFISAADLNAVEGQDNVIAINYAGNKFVGSVYSGANNLQLYSSDLTGHNVQLFGTPLPTGSGEVVLGVSLGKSGFAQGDIFAGSQGDGNIYHYANSGGAPSLFATLPSGSGVVRQISFDSVGSFGNNMLVTTTSGNIFKVNSSGTPQLIASIGADTEGIDVATKAWGKYAGYLLVASEGLNTVTLVSPTGQIINTGLSIPAAESVNFVPLNLGQSGNPVEGFYDANFPVDIQKADASGFAGLQGDAIITSEFGGNSPVWDLHYDPVLDQFSLTQIATLPNQSEDGIFVTADRISALVPEPSSMALLTLGSAGMGLWLRRRRSA